MDMQPVSSSNIAAVGYDETTSTLAVEFKTGKTYEYSEVPPEEFANLIGASSVGSYFINNIKNSFPTRKI
jgi:hypothetical protein